MRVLVLAGGDSTLLSGSNLMARQLAEQLALLQSFDVTLAYPMHLLERFATVSSSINLLPIEGEGGLGHVEADAVHLVDISESSMLRLAIQLSQMHGIPMYLTLATDAELWEDRPLAEAACRLAEHIFVLTEAEYTLVRTIGVRMEKMSLLPLIPQLPEITSLDFSNETGIPLHAPVILFIGRKLESKGYGLVLQATEAVWRFREDVCFVFIGPDTDASASMLRHYSRDKRITNLGIVSEELKLSALHACAMLCVPSTIDVFPLVYLEAWKCGKPIIASIMRGLHQVIRHEEDGLVVEANAEQVAAGIIHILADEGAASKLGIAGRERVDREHSQLKAGQVLANVYGNGGSFL